MIVTTAMFDKNSENPEWDINIGSGADALEISGDGSTVAVVKSSSAGLTKITEDGNSNAYFAGSGVGKHVSISYSGEHILVGQGKYADGGEALLFERMEIVMYPKSLNRPVITSIVIIK